MNTNDKTLANVQPGGRVRLGDQLPPLPQMGYEERGTGMGPHDVYYTPVAYTAEQMRDYARAALSAQPSPGGQDALLPCPFCGESLTINGAGDGVHPRDSDCILAQHVVVADHAPHAAAWNRRALAARQPVGEVIAWHWPSTGVVCSAEAVNRDRAPTDNAVPLYAAPPAQAVDLGQLRALARNWIIGYGGTVGEARRACADELLALIDGKAVGK
ncbi:hypothetical protein [Stenotrophomonas sp. GD03958]|uniref:hypothetical protein n=1 Tax=Stenotrophomonas sp. GD03958 TaxID=2975411 RepID=UPI00244D3BD8|nr:hypothetical protein [Stenotrophomonas sp. GD03958]MDH1192482.1 Lar family restriction alleviation protein [Stenotrophomonas sp. GD03958]